jgi:hypothetical protein
MEGQRFNEYEGQFMYIALDDTMRCFDSVRDSIQALSQGALGANMEHAERTAKDNTTRMTTIITADGPSEEVLSWKRTIALWMKKGKAIREPDGTMTNAERNKKETRNNRLELIIAWITEEELEALETDEETSKLETMIKLQTTRREVKRCTKEQRRGLISRRNNERYHVRLPIGLPQGGQASALAWKFTANILLKTQEKVSEDALDEYLTAKDKEKTVNGVIKVKNWEGQEYDLHGAALADDLSTCTLCHTQKHSLRPFALSILTHLGCP